MKNRKPIPYFLFLLLWTGGIVHVNAQQNGRLDESLTKDFKQLREAVFGNDYHYSDSLNHLFKDRIKKELATQESFAESFDSLSGDIWIIQSKDKLVRTFSWDEMSGGTWHDMAAFVQFKTRSGKIGVMQMDTDREMELGGYTDVLIKQIEQVTINHQIHYLMIGYGTHGAGHHHTTAQIFSIQGEKLIKCTRCFESGEDLAIESSRRYHSELTYDPLTNEISYNEFVEDEGGFKLPTGKKITLKLVNNTFKKQN